LRVSSIVWAGESYGGAERFALMLTREMVAQGQDAGITFVSRAGVFGAACKQDGIPYSEAGFSRGAAALLRPRRLVEHLVPARADAAILPSAGFLARAIRLGGFDGCIVSVEHGRLLQEQRMGTFERLKSVVDRRVGLGAPDIQVAVSDYMLQAVRGVPHAQEMLCIYNGIPVKDYALRERPPSPSASSDMIFGAAGRMVDGKGFEDLVRAVSLIEKAARPRVRLAGDGPERMRLESLVADLGVADRIDFCGRVDDMVRFWSQVHVCVVPTNRMQEAFGMVAVEGMAAGCPVVASRTGALPEVVLDGESGLLYEPGNVTALASCIIEYSEDPERYATHSANARKRAEKFDIGLTAEKYLEVIRESGRLARDHDR
jgi:glycosyltransferase involved in cell wall biosynthesis